MSEFYYSSHLIEFPHFCIALALSHMVDISPFKTLFKFQFFCSTFPEKKWEASQQRKTQQTTTPSSHWIHKMSRECGGKINARIINHKTLEMISTFYSHRFWVLLFSVLSLIHLHTTPPNSVWWDAHTSSVVCEVFSLKTFRKLLALHLPSMAVKNREARRHRDLICRAWCCWSG